MNNPVVSTFDVGAKWIGEIREELSARPNTRDLFPFSNESGNLLLHERLTGEPATYAKTTSFPTLGQHSNPSVSARETLRVEPARINLPRVQQVNTLPKERYILLKKYEGFVTERNAESFTACLRENASDYPALEVQFDVEELSETDRALVVEGVAIVWTIGYRYEGTTRKRESVLYVRRLPPWKDSEAEHAKKEIEELTRDIQWK